MSAQQAFEKYGDMVYRLAMIRTRNAVDAEDVVQEVFLRYLRSAPPWSDAEHEKAWLIRVAINCSTSSVTSTWNQRMTALHEESGGSSVAAPDDIAADVIAAVEVSEVYRAVSRLPEKYRTAVHLHYYEGLATAHIAELLESNDATIRSWLHRARAMLRETIEVDRDEDFEKACEE
jgi:RNA polymerase sigma-70 factor (ECF subfamily)